MLGAPMYFFASIFSFVTNVEAAYIRPLQQAKMEHASLMQREPVEPESVIHHYKTPAPESELGRKRTDAEKPMTSAPAAKPMMKGKMAEPSSDGERGTKWSELWVLILICVLCAGLFAFLGYHICCRRRRNTRASIRGIERLPITALREGEWAKIVGTVVPAQELEMRGPQVLNSPLQGITCVHFNVTTVTNGREIARRHDCTDFYLQDETGGLVLIHATDVCAYHLKNVFRENHGYDRLPEPCLQFLQNSRVQQVDDKLAGIYEFEESVLPVGSRVVALGVCTRLPRSGQLSLQSDTAVRKLEKGEEGFVRRALQESVEREDWQMMAAHVLVSDDPTLF